MTRRMTCPHCGGTRRMHPSEPYGECIHCGGAGSVEERAALVYAAVNRTIAREGVRDGDISPGRALELEKQADEIEAFFAKGAP